MLAGLLMVFTRKGGRDMKFIMSNFKLIVYIKLRKPEGEDNFLDFSNLVASYLKKFQRGSNRNGWLMLMHRYISNQLISSLYQLAILPVSLDYRTCGFIWIFVTLASNLIWNYWCTTFRLGLHWWNQGFLPYSCPKSLSTLLM